MELSVNMARTAKKIGRGRPGKPEAEKQTNVPVRLPPAMIEAIDAERATRIDAPNRSVIIRELVAAGLKQLKKGKIT